MPSDIVVLEYTDAKTTRRRVRLRDRGDRMGYWREEQAYRDGEWTTTGREVVTDVAVATDTEELAEDERAELGAQR